MKRPHVLGIARSSVANGDTETAAQSYRTLQRFLADADADVPFLDEVRSYEPTTEDK